MSDNEEEIKSLSPTFDLITEELIEKWEKILKLNKLEKARLVADDINFDDYNLKYDWLQTIQNDSKRTRVRERFNFNNFEQTLQKILIYFCKLNNIEYKQGLNEILDYYYETDLFSFISSISLVNLLLKYHCPDLYTLFQENNITAEMYAINWLLTTYANKNSLEITYMLWDILLEENDQLFIHFMVIAFLLYHKEKIGETDGSSIPVFFSKNQVSTKELLNDLVKSISFRLLVKNLEIFKSRTTRSKELYELYNPEQILVMPVLAEELLCNMNTDLKNNKTYCINEKCDNFFMKGEIMNNNINNHYNKNTKIETFCEICRNNNLKNNVKYIIIDLRNKNDSQIKDSILNEGTFIFINSEILSQEVINKGNPGEILIEQINNDNNINIHIVLMTNDTDNYDEFEYNYQDLKEKSKKKEIPNVLSSTISLMKKKIEEQTIKKEIKQEKSLQIKMELKQYELIKILIDKLLENNYPYISYILGGYKSLHDLSIKYNIPIINHKKNNCYICINKSLEENDIDRKEPSYKIINRERTYSLHNRKFSDFFRKKSDANKEEKKSDLINTIIEEIPVIKMNEYLTDKNNKIYHCLLVWHNMNDINEKVIIIIFERSINIYKMNVKKEGIFFNLMEKILFEYIKDVKRDKNIFNLYYKKEEKNNDIKIDTFTDNDGESFFKIMNDILEENKKNNNI